MVKAAAISFGLVFIIVGIMLAILAILLAGALKVMGRGMGQLLVCTLPRRHDASRWRE